MNARLEKGELTSLDLEKLEQEIMERINERLNTLPVLFLQEKKVEISFTLMPAVDKCAVYCSKN